MSDSSPSDSDRPRDSALFSILAFGFLTAATACHLQLVGIVASLLAVNLLADRSRIPGQWTFPVAGMLGTFTGLLLARQPFYMAPLDIFILFPTGGVLYSTALWIRRTFAADSRAEFVARRDSLTGLLNKQGLDERLQLEIARAARTGDSFCLACLDCDGFKAWNDLQGHLAGDRFLKAVAQTLSAGVRPYDSIARWGGDEFLVLLPGCTLSTGRAALERLHSSLKSVSPPSQPALSWSTGAVVVTTGRSLKDIVEAADQRMYAAKKQGGGMILIEELTPPPEPVTDLEKVSR